MKLTTIEGFWLAFERRVISPLAPREYVEQMKMSYFAGAAALFSLSMSSRDPDAETTQADTQKLVDIEAELNAFAESCGKGIVP